jgi:hypothetical protein
MFRARFIPIAALAILALTGISCAESSPTAPSAVTTTAPDGELLELLGLESTLRRVGLLTCSPMPGASASAIIGPAGGSIRVGPHRLDIPAGALDQRVLISATAPTGRVNRVELLPHGLQFDVPAKLTMSYANCDLLGSTLPKRIAYIDSNLNILELLRSVDDFANRRVSTRLEHFSEYAVAW